MHSKAPGPTRAERDRWDRMVRLGCVACRKNGNKGVPAEVHHLLDGGRRRGHSATIAVCSYHHRGIPLDGGTYHDYAAKHGPSLYAEAKRFHSRYGTDDELLEYQNQLLEEQHDF